MCFTTIHVHVKTFRFCFVLFKGKGKVTTYWLLGEKKPAVANVASTAVAMTTANNKNCVNSSPPAVIATTEAAPIYSVSFSSLPVACSRSNGAAAAINTVTPSKASSNRSRSTSAVAQTAQGGSPKTNSVASRGKTVSSKTNIVTSATPSRSNNVSMSNSVAHSPSLTSTKNSNVTPTPSVTTPLLSKDINA